MEKNWKTAQNRFVAVLRKLSAIWLSAYEAGDARQMRRIEGRYHKLQVAYHPRTSPH